MSRLQIVAIALGVAFFLLLPWHPYPLSFVLKPSGILVLAAIGFMSKARLSNGLAIGLCFGALGDILLDIDFFLLGLVSFLISHLVYIALFGLTLKDIGQTQRGAAPFLVLLAFVMGGLVFWILPNLGDMAVPVLAYFMVIMVMAALSYLTPFASLRVPIGASLFVLSDAMIGVSKFKMDFWAADQLIWMIYFAAQFLILTGFLLGTIKSGTKG